MSNDTPTSIPWPDYVLQEVESLEAKHGIELVSAEHAERLAGIIEQTDRELTAAQKEIAELRAKCERLEGGITAANDLMLESYGVAGLHRNGDVAPWGELRTGGRHEEWLVKFDDAIKSTAKAASEKGAT